MIFQLFKRDFTAQYKKSFLGLNWTLITPLFGIASWVLMQMTGILTPGEVGVPYPIYVLVGTSCWSVFMGIIGSSSSTLSAASGLLLQIKFHHEAVFIEQILLNIVNTMISFVMILIGISLFDVFPKWQTVFFPLLIVPIFFYAASFGLLIAMMKIVAIDISNLVNKLMNFIIYTAPIIYAPTIDNLFLRLVNKWNPLTYIICSMRDLILYGRVYNWEGLLISSALGLFLFAIVWRAFYVSEDKLIERMV